MNKGANSRTVSTIETTIVVSAISAAVGGAVGAVVTISITKGIPNVWREYQTRRFAPKKAHEQYALDQADWFEERADKLDALGFQLGREPKPNRFKRDEMVSKLDRHDWQWAMQLTDIEILRKAVAEKAAECRLNVGESRRSADEISKTIFR